MVGLGVGAALVCGSGVASADAGGTKSAPSNPGGSGSNSSASRQEGSGNDDDSGGAATKPSRHKHAMSLPRYAGLPDNSHGKYLSTPLISARYERANTAKNERADGQPTTGHVVGSERSDGPLPSMRVSDADVDAPVLTSVRRETDSTEADIPSGDRAGTNAAGLARAFRTPASRLEAVGNASLIGDEFASAGTLPSQTDVSGEERVVASTLVSLAAAVTGYATLDELGADGALIYYPGFVYDEWDSTYFPDAYNPQYITYTYRFPFAKDPGFEALAKEEGYDIKDYTVWVLETGPDVTEGPNGLPVPVDSHILSATQASMGTSFDQIYADAEGNPVEAKQHWIALLNPDIAPNFIIAPGGRDTDGDGTPDEVDPAPNDPTIPTPINNPPIAIGATITSEDQENGTIKGYVVASDLDGDPLHYDIWEQPRLGYAGVNEETGEWSYQPIPGKRPENGYGNFTDVFYVMVIDDKGAFVNQKVTVPVLEEPPTVGEVIDDPIDNFFGPIFDAVGAASLLLLIPPFTPVGLVVNTVISGLSITINAGQLVGQLAYCATHTDNCNWTEVADEATDIFVDAIGFIPGAKLLKVHDFAAGVVQYVLQYALGRAI
jgi:hypothetical protein